MNKILFPLMAAFALPFACTRLEEPSVAPDGNDGTLLVISAGSSPLTKIALNEDNSVSFLETDALSVFCRIDESSFENSKFTVSRLYDNGSADFQGTVASTEEQMPVMYPYKKDAYIEKYGQTRKLYFSVPAEQKAVPGTFDPDAAISLGMASVGEDGKAGVSLSNACALVKFTVPLGEYSKVTLSASGCEICGPCSVNAMGTIGDISITTGGESTVSLTGDIDGGSTYFLAVVPGTATGGISVSLYDKDGKQAGEKSTANPVTFTAGHILNIGLLPTTSPTWSGSGTEADPYLIETSAHLRLLAQAFSLRETATPYAGKHFLQTADIDMAGEEITIGNYKDRYRDTEPAWGVPTYFNAIYDGGGYTISGYRLKFISNRDCQYNAGLFNCVRNAEIKNLKVRPALGAGWNLIGGITDVNGYYHIGMLVGYLSGNTVISGCTSLARSDGSTYIVECTEETGFLGDTPLTINFGGLIGYISENLYETVTISNCTNEANLILEKGSNMDVIGGLIGSNYYETATINIDRCRNKGDVTARSNKAEVYAGGIFGRITDGSGGDILVHISNCVNEGNVEAITQASEDACAGGMAGSNNSDGWGLMQFENKDPWVYNCLNKGNIYAKGNDAMAGGIFGYCYDSDTKLALCVNTGRIYAEGDPKIGPICATGHNSGDRGTHWRCFWLVPDEFKEYDPGVHDYCYPCTDGSISGGQDAGTPEYVRLHGKANDTETEGTLFEKTEWSKDQWKAAASWKGTSDVHWGDPGHVNNLDLEF